MRHVNKVIWCYLCLISSASLDEGSSAASMLSGQVQSLLPHSRYIEFDMLDSPCLSLFALFSLQVQIS